MAGLGRTLTTTVLSMVTSTTTGVNARVGATALNEAGIPTPGVRAIAALNASVDISEKTARMQYPALLVYCDKFSNTLKEKFRTFSGKAHTVIEIRHSQDILDGLETNLETYVDAVCAVLDASRGDWGSGLFYGGGYEVSYEPVARGGSNFLQRAKVGFDVEVSK